MTNDVYTKLMKHGQWLARSQGMTATSAISEEMAVVNLKIRCSKVYEACNKFQFDKMGHLLKPR